MKFDSDRFVCPYPNVSWDVEARTYGKVRIRSNISFCARRGFCADFRVNAFKNLFVFCLLMANETGPRIIVKRSTCDSS